MVQEENCSSAFSLLVNACFFVMVTQSFERTIPREVPVSVLPKNDNVAQDNLSAIKNVIEPFSRPRITSSKETALKLLKREEVYAVVEVPEMSGGTSENVLTFTIYVDGSMVPIQKSSKYLMGVASDYIRDISPSLLSLELRTVGKEKTISQYLFPGFFLLVIMILALLYVPYNLSEDEGILERLRVDASLESMVSAKIMFFALIVFLPALVFQLLGYYFGASLEIFSPGTLGFGLLTFSYLACISTSITFLTNLSNWGRIFNILLLFFFLTFSSLFYPLGFFGSQIQKMGEYLPTLYSGVAMRGTMLRGLGLSYFTDWFIILLGVTGITFLTLKISIEYHRRRE